MTTSRSEPTAPAVSDIEVNEFHAYLAAHAAGHDHALPARALVAALKLGAGGDRTLRALAHRATELGLLLCADNAGYFVPTSPQEVEEMVGRLQGQAAQMSERARRIQTLSDRHFYSHQMPLI